MEEELKTPVMFDHCLAVYEKMASQAERNELDELLYTGFLTRLFHSLNLPSPYYTAIKDNLVAMGCVRHVRRGGGNAKSVWELLTPPTPELYHNIVTLNKPKTSRLHQLEQQVRDLHKRVVELERVR